MHELKEKLKPVSEIKEKLTTWTHEEVEKGKECADTKELGEVVDMIKDLAEVEEKCWKAKYYESIVTAMAEAEEEEEMMEKMGRMGYDHYRYPSSGRFASTGHGKRYGYVPPHMMDPDGPFIRRMMDKDFDHDMDYRLGYPKDGTSTSRGSQYGRSYDQFNDARRHYRETHSSEDEARMNEHAKEHMRDTVETIRDIWEDATPELRKKMKADLGKLLNELG